MDLNSLIAISIFCWGVWGIFDKLALEHSSHRDVVLMLYALYLPAIPIVAALLHAFVPGWHLTVPVMLWTALAAFTYTVAVVAYLTALSQTEASYVLGITAGYPLITQFLSVLMLGESLVTSRLLGAGLICAGIVAIGGSSDHLQANLRGRDRLVLIGCVALATVCWGVYGVFDKKAVSIAHPLEVYFAQCLWDSVFLILAWFIFRLQGHRAQMRDIRTWKFCALSSLSILVGSFTYLTALSKSSASYVISITGTYPLLMYLFAILMLKEKFNRGRLLGIALVVAGGVLVQYTQDIR